MSEIDIVPFLPCTAPINLTVPYIPPMSSSMSKRRPIDAQRYVVTYRAHQRFLPPLNPCCWFDGATVNFGFSRSICWDRCELPVRSNRVRQKEKLYRRWVLTQIEERMTGALSNYRTDRKRRGATNESRSVISRAVGQIRENPLSETIAGALMREATGTLQRPIRWRLR